MKAIFFKEYGDFLSKRIKIKKPIKIVFDCSNGYAGCALKEAVKENKNIKVFYINDAPNGNFPGRGPDPTAEGALQKLSDQVVLKKADFGAAFDGDGDRVVFVDDKGREIDSDTVIQLYINYRKPKTIIVDIRAGKSVKKKGVKVIKTKVGNFYIKQAMIKHNASFGAERSGHYYFKIQNSYIDEPIIMTFVFASIISNFLKKNKISEWADKNTAYFRIKEKNYSVENKKAVFSLIKKKYRKFNPKWSDFDGLTAEFKDFWFNVRLSSNEDKIRLNMEAKTGEILEREIKRIESCFGAK